MVDADVTSASALIGTPTKQRSKAQLNRDRYRQRAFFWGLRRGIACHVGPPGLVGQNVVVLLKLREKQEEAAGTSSNDMNTHLVKPYHFVGFTKSALVETFRL